jgi:SPP1 gp7 family putative phage head morphogenesis protein
MCDCKTNKHMTMNGAMVLNFDPTRTLTVRNRFVSDARARFNALRKIITDAIVNDDILGLTDGPTIKRVTSLKGNVDRLPFEFETTADKTESFMEWLAEQEQNNVLQVTTRPGTLIGAGTNVPWSNKYIDSSYQAGIRRGRSELRKAGVDVPPEPAGFTGVPIGFNQPIHADTLASLHNRVFTDLKGITTAMDTAISRTLTQGLLDGRSPRDIARDLAAHVDNIGRHRAVIMARTEVVRAHHIANINEYAAAGIEGVEVQAEWQTAGDNRVCQRCKSLEGKIFPLDEIRGLIPLHPQCRCVALPVTEEILKAEREIERDAKRRVN